MFEVIKNWQDKVTIADRVGTKALFFLVFLFIVQPLTLSAAVDLNKNDTDYNEIARARSYPGGSQEEDLKVQEVLVEPVQTVYKSNVDEEIIKDFKKQRESSTEPQKAKGNR